MLIYPRLPLVLKHPIVEQPGSSMPKMLRTLTYSSRVDMVVMIHDDLLYNEGIYCKVVSSRPVYYSISHS